MRTHVLAQDKEYPIEHKDARTCFNLEQRVSYKAYKMRAHVSAQDKEYLIEHTK